MKKKFCKKVKVRDLKVGDRILIQGYSEKHGIGYVESFSDMGDGSTCAYVDMRWRKKRKSGIKWHSDTVPASQSFKVVFNTSDLWLTNMKLHDACVKAGLPLLTSELPF